MSLKEQYWRYSLVIIILLLGTIIFFKSLPFISGILGAMTIYILLRNQMLYLTVKKRMRPEPDGCFIAGGNDSLFFSTLVFGRLAVRE